MKIIRAVSLFDIHHPLVDWPTLNAALDYIRRERVDILVLGGDNLDCGPISRHTKGKPLFRPRGQMKSDLDSFRDKILDPIDKALRRTHKPVVKVWLTGNHEDWAAQVIEEQPELDGLLDFPAYLNLEHRGWLVKGQGSHYKFGHLKWLHGDVLSGNGPTACTKALNTYVESVVFGHFHTGASATKVLPLDHTQKGKWQAWAMGCVGKLDHAYLKKAPTGWLNQVAITEFYSSGLFNHYPCTVIKGRFAYGGKLYGCP